VSKAYKCDRCGEFVNEALPLRVGSADTCESCWEDFKRWMRREPTSVLQPKCVDYCAEHWAERNGEKAEKSC
jgi:hypothetical protein